MQKKAGNASGYDVRVTLTYAGLAVVFRAVAVVTLTAKRPWQVDAVAVPAVESGVTFVDI